MNKSTFKSIISDIVHRQFEDTINANACRHKILTNEALPHVIANTIQRNIHFELSRVFDSTPSDEIEKILRRILTHYSALSASQAPNLIAKLIKTNWATRILITHRIRNFCSVKGTGEEFYITDYNSNVKAANRTSFSLSKFVDDQLASIISGMLRLERTNNRSIQNLANIGHRTQNGATIQGVKLEHTIISVDSGVNNSTCTIRFHPTFDHPTARSNALAIAEKMYKLLSQCTNLKVEQGVNAYSLKVTLREQAPQVTVMSKSPLFMVSNPGEKLGTSVAIELVQANIDALKKQDSEVDDTITELLSRIQTLRDAKVEFARKVSALEETIKILSK